MKKLLLFLTLLSLSQLSHGAKKSPLEEAQDTLFKSFTDLSSYPETIHSPKDALAAVKQIDPHFSFDNFILNNGIQLLNHAITHNTLDHVQFIFENISNSTKYVILSHSEDSKTHKYLYFQEQNEKIKDYIFKNIDDRTRDQLLIQAIEIKNNNEINYILNHPSFNTQKCLPNDHLFDWHLMNYILNIMTHQENEALDPLKASLLALIDKNILHADLLAALLWQTLTTIYNQNSASLQLDSSIQDKKNIYDQYLWIIAPIIQNKNFDTDATLNYFIKKTHFVGKNYNNFASTIAWLFDTFPVHQFTDRGYINDILEKHISIKPDDNLQDNAPLLAIINLLIEKNITDISPNNHTMLKNIKNPPFNIDALTINSWTPARSCCLATIGIAAILYDFVTFKKPAKVTDDKKESKAKITEKAEITKETKKAAMPQDTKESKEKQKRSFLKRFTKHTRNYVKDLKNLRNHKKLAIPLACALVRLLKDKTPLKWY